MIAMLTLLAYLAACVVLAYAISHFTRSRKDRLRSRLAAIDAELQEIRLRKAIGRRSVQDLLRERAPESRRAETLAMLYQGRVERQVAR